MNSVLAKLKNVASAVAYRGLLTRLPAPRPQTCEFDVAVVCLAALGDFITFCPVAERLCAQGKSLALICRNGGGVGEFAEQTGFFNTILTLPHQYGERGKNLKRLGRISARTVLVAPAERHILSDLYALAIPAAERLLPDTMQGCSLPELKEKTDYLADKLISVTAVGELERYEQYLSGMGICKNSLLPFVLPWARERRSPEKVCLAVFPGAGGGAAKQWPVQRFAQVSKKLLDEIDCEFIACGTAQERQLGELLCDGLNGAENLCGKTALPELLERLKTVSLALTNDSGSAHLAIACGVPTVVVCGGWEYGRFYPNSRAPKTVTALAVPPEQLCCIPCGSSHPDCVGGEAAPCVLAVEIEQVLLAARRYLVAEQGEKT